MITGENSDDEDEGNDDSDELEGTILAYQVDQTCKYSLGLKNF